MRRTIALLALATLASTACASTFAAGAAVVNGVRIPTDAVEAQLGSTQGGGLGGQGAPEDRARSFLTQLVHNEVIRQEATRRGIEVREAEVQQRIDEIKASFPSEAEFTSRLEQEGLTLPILVDLVRSSIYRERLGGEVATPATDEQLRAEYEARRDQYRQVRARHILFEAGPQPKQARAAVREARAARARLVAGESFAALARELSDDPSAKQNGGLLSGETGPYVPLAQLDGEFARGAWDARLFRPTLPVRSSFGYHIILVTGKRIQPFAEVEPALRAELDQAQGEVAVGGVIEEALAEASIQVNPRYGDWDDTTFSIVAHQSFIPAEPLPLEGEQPSFLQPQPQGP